jgi:3-dehydroquinate synthase
MHKTFLTTGNGHSEIIIPGRFEDISLFSSKENTLLLVDENVLKAYRKELSGFNVIPISVDEKQKDISQVLTIFEEFLKLEVDRSWIIIGVGGGITTDITGFVASVYLRGLKFGFVSTTLLGQVDAAIGGKNGVNFKSYKNIIGNIRQPAFVICHTDSLKTLPASVFREGFAEIIKYAFIKKPHLFDYLEMNILAALKHDPDVLEYLIYESVMAKKEIVEADEMESGDRKLLNFGHTFAHAFEKLYGISHGSAVSAGMVLAAKLSVNLGFLPEDVISKLEKLLLKAGLPVKMQYDTDELIRTMRLDKKRKGKDIQFILLEDLGKAVIKSIPVSQLKSLLNDLR